MKTRKEIGDRDAVKSLWIIEWSYDGINWYLWDTEGYRNKSVAGIRRNQIYKDYKQKFPKKTTRRSFRLALYSRAE